MHCMCSSIAKGTSPAEVTSNNKKKIKPVALAIVKSEGIRQLVSQSVENSVKQIYLKFHSNFLKVFQFNLKACLGLTNTTLSSSRKIVTDFR